MSRRITRQGWMRFHADIGQGIESRDYNTRWSGLVPCYAGSLTEFRVLAERECRKRGLVRFQVFSGGGVGRMIADEVVAVAVEARQ